MEATQQGRSPGRASREAFVAATARLLRRQGYAATGLSEIVTAGGAPRGSLYFHFPGGKQELATVAMRASGEQLRAGIAVALAHGPTLADSVCGIVAALAAGLEASGFRDGCPIATVALEAGPGEEALRETAQEVFASWLAELESALRKEGLASEQARTRAVFVLAAIEGGLLLARARHDAEPLREVGEELRALLA
jgi:TetR/AcrR family transcriptional repressor of lmrAB and yxaGH operons